MTEFRIWEGIADRFPDAVAPQPEAFFSERWRQSEHDRVSAAIARMDAEGHSPTAMVSTSPLPALIAPLATPDAALRVLDFGGGAGALYPVLRGSLPAAKLDMHIVETEVVCALGRALFAGRDGPTFHHTDPEGAFDVVHAASSLHYVADWRAQLARFAAASPRLIALVGLTAGDIPTFVTRQQYYGHRIPVWFWNIAEIVDAMAALSYRLVYRSVLDMPYLGVHGPLPMGHFPPSHRLPRKCNLAFVPEAR